MTVSADRARELFVTTAAVAGDLLAHPTVAEAWEQPSALEGYTVAGLAGHLARAVLTVERYLDAATAEIVDPDGSPATDPDVLLDPAGYFAAVLGDHDPVASELHRAVRERGIDTSQDGPAALAATVRATTTQLADRLDEDALAQPVRVMDGHTITVADYLTTRLVELVVHVDDLAVSVGVDEPAPSEEACREVAGVLAQTAALRLGGRHAVRALARRERHPEALRAL